MRSVRALDDVFGGRSHIRVLRALHGLPAGGTASIREIARRAGVSHPTASAVLDPLREIGIVTVRRTPLSDEYSLEPGHVLAETLSRMFTKEEELVADLVAFLRTNIAAAAPWVSAAWLFGSAAHSEMEPASDIDVALICPADRVEELETLMEDLSDQTRRMFGNRLQAIIGTRPIADLLRRGSGVALWRTIEKEGIPLLPASERAAAG